MAKRFVEALRITALALMAPDLREVWDAIQYMAATGRQWAQLPKEFPPFTTVQYYFYQLRDSGVLDVINETLVAAARLLSGLKHVEPIR